MRCNLQIKPYVGIGNVGEKAGMCAGLGVFVMFDHFILQSASICKCVYPAGTGDGYNSSG